MPERKQVERIAAAGSVPLGTLYGVLAALGETEIPKDPQSLEVALKAQASRIKTILDERKALSVDDPKIKRLVAAADTAIGEGAIKAARGFLDEAKQAVEDSRDTIEKVEAEARAKRIANAEVLMKSAETAEIDFDFDGAAKDYAAAFDWVKDADKTLAAKYKTREADAMQTDLPLSRRRRRSCSRPSPPMNRHWPWCRAATIPSQWVEDHQQSRQFLSQF